MILTKYSAQQKLHTLLKCHPNTIVEIGINIQEDGEAKICYQGKAIEVQKWLAAQNTIFTYDDVMLKVKGGSMNFEDNVQFQVKYLYLPHMAIKNRCFGTPIKAAKFYQDTYNNAFCANVEACFDVDKFIDAKYQGL